MIWFVTEKFHFVKRKIFIEEDIRFFRVSFFVSSAFVNLTRAFFIDLRAAFTEKSSKNKYKTAYSQKNGVE
jgi:hypothetical protein